MLSSLLSYRTWTTPIRIATDCVETIPEFPTVSNYRTKYLSRTMHPTTPFHFLQRTTYPSMRRVAGWLWCQVRVYTSTKWFGNRNLSASCQATEALQTYSSTRFWRRIILKQTLASYLELSCTAAQVRQEVDSAKMPYYSAIFGLAPAVNAALAIYWYLFLVCRCSCTISSLQYLLFA